MELFQKSIQDALATNISEGHRWEAYKIDHLQANENLKKFSEHLEVDIMVPIGSKAMIPGTLYNTGVVFVSHYQNLITKCSAHQAGKLCHKRLTLAQERLDALEAEYKRYVNKLQMPLTENAFNFSADKQEIIEEYDEAKEDEWRKNHRENVKKMKQIEAEERKKDKKKVDKNILDMLDELELIEELNEELVAFNDNEIQEKIQSFSDKQNVQASTMNGMDDDDNDDNYTDSSVDDNIPKPFRKLVKQTKDMSLDEQLTFFQSNSDELQTFLSKSIPTTFEELNEKTDKIVLYDHLKQKLDDIRAEIKRQKKRKQITALNANISTTSYENVVVPSKSLQKRVSFDGQDQIREFTSDENCNKLLSTTIDNNTKSIKPPSSSSLTYHLAIRHTESVFNGASAEKIDFCQVNDAIIRHPADIFDWYSATKISLQNATTLKSILKSKRNVLNTDVYTQMKSLETNSNNNNNEDDDDIQKRKEEFNKIMDDMFGEVFQRSDPNLVPVVNNEKEKPLVIEKSVNSNNVRPKKKVSLFKQSRNRIE